MNARIAPLSLYALALHRAAQMGSAFTLATWASKNGFEFHVSSCFCSFRLPCIALPKTQRRFAVEFFILIVNLARWFSHASVLPFITSDNDKLSEVIKMLVNKDCDYSVNGIISDNFR